MIVAVFILVLFALFFWFVAEDLRDVILGELEEIGVGESPLVEAPGVHTFGGLSATLTETSVVGADLPFDWESA